MAQAEWQDIGNKQGWLAPQQGDLSLTKPPPGHPDEMKEVNPNDLEAPQSLLPTGEIMLVRIEKYGERNWAVYIQGEKTPERLLCVTAYLKGAAAVKALLEDMAERIAQGKGRLTTLEGELEKLRV